MFIKEGHSSNIQTHKTPREKFEMLQNNAVELDIDTIIDKLLEVRGAKPPKQVNLTEAEVRGLCIKSREIFISQPILLELDAPLKICGNFVPGHKINLTDVPFR